MALIASAQRHSTVAPLLPTLAYITCSPTAIIFVLYYKNDIYNRIEMDAKTLEKGQAELSTYFDKSASTVGQAFHGYVPLLSSANVSG